MNSVSALTGSENEKHTTKNYFYEVNKIYFKKTLTVNRKEKDAKKS